jgi:3-oxoacyl-[acyl-carrier-protein] synthase II
VFGAHADALSVSSTKSATGHMLGAAGSVEFIACALAIRDNIIPPTINYTTPDPECDLDVTPNTAKSRPVNVAVSNSSGFGGHNVSIAVRRFEG